MEKVTIYTHGDSNGDPGPAAIALQIVDSKGKVLKEVSEVIGNAFHEYAEYFAVVRGLQVAIEHFGDKTKKFDFELRVSGELVKKQLNGEETITHPALVPQFIEIYNMKVLHFPNIDVVYEKEGSGEAVRTLVEEKLDV